MTAPLPSLYAPKVEVSWDGSGTFAGPYDDVTRDAAADPGLVIDTGRDGARTMNPPKVPSASFTLRNDTARYSHESSSSPVYQLVTPGTPVRVSASYGAVDRYTATGLYTAEDTYDGVGTWRLATTRIDEISQDAALGQQRVAVNTLGLSSTLVGRVITVPIATDRRTDECIALVLDAAGWPVDTRALSLGDTIIRYFWVDEGSAWDALLSITAAEGPGACLYEDADGVLRWEGRNYRAVTPRSVTPQATFFDTGFAPSTAYTEPSLYTETDLYDGGTSALYFQELQYTPGWRNIFARATYPTTTRQLGALGMVWQYGSVLNLTAGQQRTIIARPQDPFMNAVSPAVTTDYVVSAGSATVTLTYTSGLVAFISITAGGGGCTISGPAADPARGLQLRAQPLSILSQSVVQSTLPMTSSAETYLGLQTLALGGWPEIDVASAEAVCDAWVERYNVERPQIIMTVRAGDRKHLEQIIHREVSDRVTIRERNTGLNGDVWIESREITAVGAGGRALAVTWGTEQVAVTTGDLWDASTTLWDSAHWGR
jgi:hypothetical protein